jgi:hypothetical protein
MVNPVALPHRNGSRRLQQRCHGCGAGRSQEDVGCERDQFCRVSVNIAGIGPAGFDPQVAALAPSQLAERLCERREPGLSLGIASDEIQEHADAPHALALLRARHEGPKKRRRRRAAEQRYELAAFHVWMAPAWQEKM